MEDLSGSFNFNEELRFIALLGNVIENEYIEPKFEKKYIFEFVNGHIFKYKFELLLIKKSYLKCKMSSLNILVIN